MVPCVSYQSPGLRLTIIYTGLRRIEELRDLLRDERILDSLGILLDWRYLHADLLLALARPDQPPVSLLALDLDHFKPVNDRFGHDAGDAVLVGYMTVVKDAVGTLGTAFRCGGDEVRVLLPGFEQKRAVDVAEMIRAGVSAMKIEFQDHILPRVTASIGVATTPPAPRDPSLDQLADLRQKQAKDGGRNQVVSR